MPLKLVVVGVGHMGAIHLGKLASFEDVELVGVVDTDTERARNLSDRYSIPSFGNYSETIGSVDGAIIATPTEAHFPIASDFLRSGSHVFIEKPIAASQEEAKQLIELARTKGVILQIGHLERFNPAFRSAIPFVKKPVFIEACRASGFTGRSTDIDVILDLMIHDIDLVLSLVGDDVKEIRAEGVSFVMDKLDMASARVEFEGGCVANLTANRIALGRQRTLTVFEDDRCLYIDMLSSKLTTMVKREGGAIETTDYVSDSPDAVKEELTAFIQSVRNRTAPVVKGEDGLKALALADHIRNHIAERKTRYAL